MAKVKISKSRKSYKKCSIDFCSGNMVAFELCDRHYRRKKNFGHPLSTNRPIIKKCLAKDCNAIPARSGFCQKHFRRLNLYGDPLKGSYGNPLPEKCKSVKCLNTPRNHSGYCGMHYQRWVKYGDPDICLQPRNLPTVVRFWHKVVKTETCWLWQGSKTQSGYGIITINRKTIRAHRYSFFLTNGIWPIPMCLHSCDTPACVNPDHLSAGSAQDNSNDIALRSRRSNKKA